MSEFKTVSPDFINLDPKKRVNYTHGLVLGVDEFQQEQYYHLHKHRSHNCALHGYGTVCGLKVSIENSSQGAEIIISPGLAIDRKGREICVSAKQCAVLNDWLGQAEQRQLIEQNLTGSPAELTLYVVLCYRECPTDAVPIPGEPCQSVEDNSAASRMTESFALRLQLNSPAQWQELGIYALGELFRQIPVQAAPGSITEEDLASLLAALGTRLHALQCQNGSPAIQVDKQEIIQQVTELLDEFAGDSSPIVSPAATELSIHPDDAATLFEFAMQLWVTEIQATLVCTRCDDDGRCIAPTCPDCAADSEDDACLLLSRIDLEVELFEDRYRAVEESIIIDPADRAVLLSTRVIQEFLANQLAVSGGQGAQGEQGIQGEPGVQGEPGIPGSVGIQGIPGSQGEQGETGAQGIAGDQGERGPAGSVDDSAFVRALGGGAYAIVAAGRIEIAAGSNPSLIPPVYGGLELTRVPLLSPFPRSINQFRLNFDAYQSFGAPTGTLNYIVKATFEVQGISNAQTMTFFVQSFGRAGIDVLVNAPAEPRVYNLMIEVSAFGTALN